MKYNLDNIKTLTYDEFKKLPKGELLNLSKIIREYIYKTVIKNGGHMSSNIGDVELVVALHHVFDLKNNPIIFDIGHQAYAHKIITNRASTFDTLRKPDGISGFINENESKFDWLSTGHAGLSIAYSIGKNYIENDFVVAFLGDGAFCNLLNISSLNYLSKLGKNILIVINNNKMNISPSFGSYYDILNDQKKASKFFKLLGLDFIYQKDGNNLYKVIDDLKNIKFNKRPIVYLCETIKNYGFENDKDGKYHAIVKKEDTTNKMWPMIISDTLEKYINSNTYIVQSGMTYGFSMLNLSENLGRRYLDFGMNEEVSLTVANGLIKDDNFIIVPLYSTFMQRAYDQVLNDISRQNKKILFLINRDGLIDGDDSTHQGIYTSAILKTMPNMKIFYPLCKNNLDDIFKKFFNKDNIYPMALVYSKEMYLDIDYKPVEKNTFYDIVKYGKKAVLISFGRLLEQNYNTLLDYDITIINYHTYFNDDLKKYEFYKKIFNYNIPIISYSEEICDIAIFNEVNKFKNELNFNQKVFELSINKKVASQNSREQLLKNNNLDISKIIDILKKLH